MNKFPERLRELRKLKKITQHDLSKQLNFGYTAIANYESGRNQPSLDTLIHISEYLDVTVDYLIGTSDYPTREKGLLKNEAELLNEFRALGERDKFVVFELVKALLQ